MSLRVSSKVNYLKSNISTKLSSIKRSSSTKLYKSSRKLNFTKAIVKKLSSEQVSKNGLNEKSNVKVYESLETKEADNNIKSKLKELLQPDAQGNVHEEQLQNAIVSCLLEKESKEIKNEYLKAFNESLGRGQVEDSVKLALKKLVGSGLISEKKAETINGISFRAAQLDNNLEALFDNRGSRFDNTIAVKSLDSAIDVAINSLKGIESGEIKVDLRSLNAQSNIKPTGAGVGGVNHGRNGFLWKPVSESDGNLVVLFPSSLTGNISSSGIYSELPICEENLIEKGRFSGDSKNGGRAHFRFNNPGGSYPDVAYVVAELRDGTTTYFQIAESSKRNG